MIKKLIKQYIWLNILYRLVKEMSVCIKIKNKNFFFKTGQRNQKGDLEKSVIFYDRVVVWYNQIVPIEHGFLQNKKVLEVGPGDSLAMALRFLQFGAQEVTCVDKFYCERDEEFEQSLYMAIESKYSSSFLRDGKLPHDKIAYNYGRGIEELDKKDYYDFICSISVLEHIYDIDRAIDSMDKMLVVGGVMAHRIDLRDHAMFEYHHPLTFLTIHESLYKSFSYCSNNPNRRRINYYQNKMKTMGNYEYQIFVTAVNNKNLHTFKEKVILGVDYDICDVELIDNIRDNLSQDFKTLTDEELLITDIFLYATKQHHRGEV